MKSSIAFAAIALAALFVPNRAAAQGVPLAISYQAVLTDDANEPLSPGAPTNYTVTFRVFDAVEDGNLLWAETQGVSVFAGSFSTLLGTGDEVTGEPYPQLDTIFNEALRFLEITIDDSGTPKTFTPRQRMVSSPFAFRSKVSEQALSVADGVVSTGQLANGSVTASKIADNSVSGGAIQTDAIGESEIKSNAVGSSEIASGAVNIDELAAAVQQRLMPAGTVVAWAGTKDLNHSYYGGVPAGWILCDGRALSLSSYPELWKAIGPAYGYSGSTFNVPDYRGYFLRGQGTTTAHDPDLNSRSAASSSYSSYADGVGSTQSNQVQSHYHTWSYWDSAGDGGDAAGEWDTGPGRQVTRTHNTSSTGGNETRPKNRSVWYIIKAH